jgi:hypothetical protein
VILPLSNRLLAELIEKLFEIPRLDKQTLIMNFCGIEVDFKSSRRFRLSLIGQLAVIAWLITLLLIDGCIMQLQHLSEKDYCPIETSQCFMMGQFSKHERIVCEPGEAISNSTKVHVMCFVWVYAEQTTVNVLNQIGICSSVFALLCHVFKASCRMSRKLWGLILLILLNIASVALFIASVIIELNISLTSKLLLIGFSLLTSNVIQLFQFARYYKCERFITWGKGTHC